MPLAGRIYAHVASIEDLARTLYSVMESNAQQNADLAAEWRPDPPGIVLTPWQMLRLGLEHLIANEAQAARDAEAEKGEQP